jgi:serine/threonine-protein phosphatase 5
VIYFRLVLNNQVLNLPLTSDPQDDVLGFAQRRNRGGGYSFGADVTSRFLDLNGLELLVRSHECVSLGFEALHDERCVTVFSVPMYYGWDSDFPNLGALVRFDQRGGGMAPRYVQYDTLASSREEEELDYPEAAV